MKTDDDELADRLAIQDLVYNYAHAIDLREEPLFASLWIPEAVWDLGGEGGLGSFRGRAAILDAYRKSAGSGRQMHHFSSNLLVDLSGDRATGRSKSVATGRDTPLFVSYDDEYVRSGGAWRFARRIVRAHLEDLPGEIMTEDVMGAAALAELTQLLDRERMTAVIRAYAHAFDRGDWKLVRSCFTGDAVIEGSADTLPIDQALARSEQLAARYAATMHFVGNQLAEVNGDRGHVDSYLLAFHWKVAPAGADHPENLIGGARYHDTMTRQEGRWLISYRRVSRDWSAGIAPKL